jgi:hypothetical protein
MRVALRWQNLYTAARVVVCAILLTQSVFTYAAVRIRMVNEPLAASERVTLGLPAVPDRAASHLVLVSRVANRSADELDLEIETSGRRQAYRLAPHASRRIDFVWPRSDPPGTGEVTFRGTHDRWVVESVELATIHGFTRGLLNFVILPREQSTPRAAWWLWVLTALAAAFMWTPADRPMSRAARLPLATAGAVLFGLFLAAVLAPLITPYRVGLSPRTLGLGLAVFALPGALAAGRRWRDNPAWAGPGRSMAAITTCGLLAAGFYLSAMVQALERFDGNYSGFLHVQRAVAERAPFLVERPDLAQDLMLGEHGYDGQFMYLMAFDPFLLRFRDNPEEYRNVVDFPPYRYGRIGYSLLVKLFSGDEPRRYPATMIWLLVAAHAGLGAALAALARRHGSPAAVGLVYLAIPGFMMSLAFALPEAIAALGLVSGLWFWQRRRPLPAVLLLAAALLIRETGTPFALAALLSGSDDRRHRGRLLAVGLVLLPMLVWRGYVAVRLFPDFGWQAAFPDPGDFTVPFAGFVGLYSAVAAGTQPAVEVAGALVYPLILSAGLGVALVGWWRTRSVLALTAVVYGLVAVSLNYTKIWVSVPSGERGTADLFLTLLVFALTAQQANPGLARMVLGLFVALAVYAALFSPEADMVRSALLLIR